jgi:arylsulfatase A-like enzyme
LVTLADVMPTVLNIAGIESSGMDGQNMMGFADSHTEDRIFYGNCCDTWFAVMKDGYKYLWARQGNGELLFNMADDPAEQHDLSEIKPGLASEMKRMLFAKTGEFEVLPAVTSPRGTAKWPGFHSTVYPSDVLH